MSTRCAPPDQDELIRWGTGFVNALLDSADPDVLGRDYWSRARAALETGTSTMTFSEAVARTAAKLQIAGALSGESAAVIAGLARAGLSDPAVFGAWAELCRRDAVYVTALARIARDERKAAAKTARTAKASGNDPAAGEKEAPF